MFKTKPFVCFAGRKGNTNEALCDAVARAARVLVDSDLGGGVIKRRGARRGQGRASAFRTIVVFRRGDRAFFVYVFAKSARANLRRDELEPSGCWPTSI